MEKEQILNEFPFIASDPQLREQGLTLATVVELASGAYFYHAGDQCHHLALVGAGDIRVFQTSPGGREITLYHVGAGQTCMINMMCTVGSERSPAAAVVEQPVQALLLPAVHFRDWYHRYPAIQDFAMASLSERLRGVMELVSEVAFQRLDQRLAEHLLQCAGSSSSDQTLVATHDAIAAELGSSREVVSRLLKEFQRRGAVTLLRGRIVVDVPDVLEHIRRGHPEER